MHQGSFDLHAGERAAGTGEGLAADEAAPFAKGTPEQTRRPLGAFLVARIDGEPAGCGALKPLGDGTATGEIKRMYTVPDARRRGVSRAILLRLEEIAAELGDRKSTRLNSSH